MTATRIRSLYESLHQFSTETQSLMCRDFLKALKSKTKTNLADYFDEAIKENTATDKIDEPFFTEEMLKNRHQTAKERKANDAEAKGTVRVTEAMNQRKLLTIRVEDEDYSFTFLQREVPHLRGDKASGKSRNKAWIDYIGCTIDRAVLGEIKCGSDQNPFYAFIQLLTYLSELATPTQIQRTVDHKLFDEQGRKFERFDLHILLTDVNERSDKWQLRLPTKRLAEAFLVRLQKDYPSHAALIGRILCLTTNVDEFKDGHNLHCCWRV